VLLLPQPERTAASTFTIFLMLNFFIFNLLTVLDVHTTLLSVAFATARADSSFNFYDLFDA
jgi:hypothetical protein